MTVESPCVLAREFAGSGERVGGIVCPAARSADMIGVGRPHRAHRDAEILMLAGTNPNDPTDLGGEVEMQMGAGRQKHIMTKSTVVHIPSNLIHRP